MICRRCKCEFEQRKEETRCSSCLKLRRDNRRNKRRNFRAQTRHEDMIRSMMEQNGMSGRRKRSNVKPL